MLMILQISQLHKQGASSSVPWGAVHRHAGFDSISLEFWQKVRPEKSWKRSLVIINLARYLVYNQKQSLDSSGRSAVQAACWFCRDWHSLCSCSPAAFLGALQSSDTHLQVSRDFCWRPYRITHDHEQRKSKAWCWEGQQCTILNVAHRPAQFW